MTIFRVLCYKNNRRRLVFDQDVIEHLFIRCGADYYITATLTSLTLGETPSNDTVIIGDCDTGVEDTGGVLQGEVDNIIAECNCAKNNGRYVSCLAKALNVLKKEGTITGKEKGAIMKCVATQGDPCP